MSLNCDCTPAPPTESESDALLIHHSASERAGDGKKMGKLCCIVTSGVCGAILIIFGIVVLSTFDSLIKKVIDEELILKNGTETYEFWAEPPIVPYLKIYYFNLTNAEEFFNEKKKPIFDEVGPYSYREHWEKINVVFNDNGTVTYQTKKYYYFDEAESSGSENDVIHTLNIPVIVAVGQFTKMGRLAQLALSSMLVVLNESAFVSKTVKDLTWGYDDQLIDFAKKYLPKDQQMPFDKFGYFYERNGSTDGIFNVFTGSSGIENYTVIDTFNSSRKLKYWNTDECNMINGTDGTSYPPNLRPSDTIYLFNENLCRSLPLKFNNSVDHENIETYRFTPPADVFAYTSEKPENECFCVGGPPCIGGGIFNISACKFNSPSMISWPHFYQADKKYLDAVSGLNPDPLKHGLYIDIAPSLGTPLSAQARIQINFATMNVSTIKAVANMTTMIFPVLWFEDGVNKVPEEVIELVRKSVDVPRKMKSSILSVSFILGGLLLIGAIVAFIHLRFKKQLSTPITKDKHSYGSDSGHINHVISSDNPD